VADAETQFSRVLTIVNTKGLHARASAKFVQCAAKFDAQVTVAKDGSAVLGTSIMGLMMLGAGIGSEIAVSATGREAEVALAALAELVASKFGEDS
jgi:phosphocarrier protein HPr